MVQDYKEQSASFGARTFAAQPSLWPGDEHVARAHCGRQGDGAGGDAWGEEGAGGLRGLCEDVDGAWAGIEHRPCSEASIETKLKEMTNKEEEKGGAEASLVEAKQAKEGLSSALEGLATVIGQLHAP